MTPTDSVHLFWTTLYRGAVVVGLGMIVVCVALTVLHRVKERRQAAANGRRLGLYLERPLAEQLDEERRQREARGGRL